MSLLHQLGNYIKTFKINSKTRPYRASCVPGTILVAFHTFTHLAPSQKTQSWTVKWQKINFTQELLQKGGEGLRGKPGLTARKKKWEFVAREQGGGWGWEIF